MEWLERLRQKPEAYRRRVLVASTTAITALIVALWLITLGAFPTPAGGSRPASSEASSGDIFREFLEGARAILKVPR